MGAAGQAGGGDDRAFEELLTQHVGSWGAGQLLVLLVSSASWATMALLALSMVFTGMHPNWSCADASDAACAAVAADPAHAAFCSLHPGQYVWSPHTGVSIVSSFGLVCSHSYKLAIANAAFFVGYLAASAFWGAAADSAGRKAVLLASNVAAAAASMACAAAPSFWSYAAARTAVGCAAAGLPVASYVLATESVGPAARGRAGTFSQMVYHVGEVALPLLAWWLQDWRALDVAIAACCLAAAALAAPLPESPRWLLLRGRTAEAEATLAWLARLNGRSLPPGLLTGGGGSGGAAAEQPQAVADGSNSGGGSSSGGSRSDACCDDADADDQAAAALLPAKSSGCTTAAAAAGAPGGAAQQAAAAQPETLRLLLSHRMLGSFFALTALMCAICATSYYVLSLGADAMQGSVFVTFLVTSIGEVPAALTAGVASDAVGRRATVGTGLLLTGLFCGLCTLPAGWWSTLLALVAKGACSGCWTITYVYAAELMPTKIRAAAVACTNQAARIGGMAAPAIMYVAERLRLPQLPFAAVAAASLACLAALAQLPETNGKPQPDSVSELERMYGHHSRQQHHGDGGGDRVLPGSACRSCSEGSSSGGWWKARPWGSQEAGEAAGRQGSKLQRLLSRCVSSGSSWSGSGGSWLIRTGSWRQAAGDDDPPASSCETVQDGALTTTAADMELGALLPQGSTSQR